MPTPMGEGGEHATASVLILCMVPTHDAGTAELLYE